MSKVYCPKESCTCEFNCIECEKEIRANERAKVFEEVMTIIKTKVSEKEYPIKTLIELTDLGGKIQQLNNVK